MEPMEKVKMLQAIYAGALADSVMRLGGEGVTWESDGGQEGGAAGKRESAGRAIGHLKHRRSIHQALRSDGVRGLVD